MAEETVGAVAVSCSWYDVPCNASAALSWLWDAINFLPRRIWAGILDALASVVEVIPVPSFMQDIGGAGSAFFALDGAAYWADVVALGYGAEIVAGAYLARFLFSLIPVIGK